MTADDFRRIALSLPETTEGSHFGNADFRVSGRIFATLAYEKEGFGVLLLTPEQQEGMVTDAPQIFSPVKGEWGRKGATRVRLDSVEADILEGSLRTAWKLKSTAGVKKVARTSTKPAGRKRKPKRNGK
jgi:hypothetical protein